MLKVKYPKEVLEIQDTLKEYLSTFPTVVDVDVLQCIIVEGVVIGFTIKITLKDRNYEDVLKSVEKFLNTSRYDIVEHEFVVNVMGFLDGREFIKEEMFLIISALKGEG